MSHKIYHEHIKLNDGSVLSIFFNTENNLLVVDKVRKDGTGGNEFIRMDVSGIELPSKKELKGN